VTTASPGTDVDVAVVGCGPVGAVLGNLLGALGLRVAIVERELDVYHLPRASHCDGEIMRVFQTIGLADAILPCTAPIAGMDFVDAAGEKLFGYVSAPGVGPSGWANDYMFYQPDLERALRAGLARYPEVSLRLGEEVLGLSEHGDHVRVRLADDTITARYVVGTDGATPPSTTTDSTNPGW
jgi:3-(3-hydroxy-phenyl)propionate hydroxylase